MGLKVRVIRLGLGFELGLVLELGLGLGLRLGPHTTMVTNPAEAVRPRAAARARASGRPWGVGSHLRRDVHFPSSDLPIALSFFYRRTPLRLSLYLVPPLRLPSTSYLPSLYLSIRHLSLPLCPSLFLSPTPEAWMRAAMAPKHALLLSLGG